jgi:hypothetical protein
MSCSLKEDLGCLGILGCCFRTKLSIGSVDAAESVEETCFEVYEQWILSCCWEADFLGSSVSCRELKLLRWVIPRIICPAQFSSTKMYYNNSKPPVSKIKQFKWSNSKFQFQFLLSTVIALPESQKCPSSAPRVEPGIWNSIIWGFCFQSLVSRLSIYHHRRRQHQSVKIQNRNPRIPESKMGIKSLDDEEK